MANAMKAMKAKKAMGAMKLMNKKAASKIAKGKMAPDGDQSKQAGEDVSQVKPCAKQQLPATSPVAGAQARVEDAQEPALISVRTAFNGEVVVKKEFNKRIRVE